MEIGEVWAYRARGRDAPVAVEVLRFGTARPARVRVRFVDDAFEGREGWVPPARLKVPWAEVEGWLAVEDRWDALRDTADHVRGTPSEEALDLVFEHADLDGVAWVGYNRNTGLLFIRDLPRLAAELALDVEAIETDPLMLRQDDGTLVLPWAVTERVAQALARRHADVLLAEVERREADSREEAVYGHYYPARAGREEWHLSAEDCVRYDVDSRVARDMVRSWCGVEGNERARELMALRAEVLRLGVLVEGAITDLRRAGAGKVADALERELGVPVEAIRRQAAEQRHSPRYP